MGDDYNRTYIFKYGSQSPTFIRNAEIEYPNHQISVRIRLNPSKVTQELKNQISRKLGAQDMNLTWNGNIITVSGVPPHNNFDRNSVLTIVQQHNRGAQFAN